MRFVRSLLSRLIPAALLVVGWPVTIHAEPISMTAILVSVALSVAATGASLLLSRILAPKPQQQIRGKLQGDIRLSDSTWDVMKPEIYGGRFDDDIGGIELGINIIWMNREGIRERRQVVQSNPGGGGKGPPKPPPEVRISYDCDLACLVGKGPLRILRIKFNEDVVYYAPPSPGPTGVLDPTFPPEDPYDPFLLPDPRDTDNNPISRHSLLMDVDPIDGSQSGTIVGGAYSNITIYQGNDLQEPDPLIAADIDGLYGAGSTPAYLDDCYFVIEKLDISKYNGMPNIVVLAENIELQTVEEILVYRALKTGINEDDLDLSAAALTKTRGYVITSQKAVRQNMEDFAKMFNFDFVETPDGKVVAVDLADRTLVDTIEPWELGAYVNDGSEKPPTDLVTTRVPDENEMWHKVNVQFFNPLKENQVDARQDVYPFTTSKRIETAEFNATMLPEEAYRVAQRMMQMHWAGATPYQFSLPDSRIWLFCSNRIQIPITGELRTVRISEIQGIAPGILQCAAVPDELTIFAGGLLTGVLPPVDLLIPANSVATFLDIPTLHPEALPGLYIAATPRDITTGRWPGATAYRMKGGNWQQKTTFVQMATMGRTVGVLADVPADWAESREEFVSWFFAGTTAGGTYGTGALNRLPNATAELEPWSNGLLTSDPLVIGKQLARALFLSTEYMNRGRTNTEYVDDLYSAVLDRVPDGAAAAWISDLDTGTSRSDVLDGFINSEEFENRVEAAAATFFDTDSEVTLDLFVGAGEPSSITDAEGREGANFWVFGNEGTVVCLWTRDNTEPNRWVGTRMIRKLKGTGNASDDHEDGERAVLMNSAVRFVEMELEEKNVERQWKVVTVGQRVDDAAEVTVTWTGESIVDPIREAHVPEVTTAPTIFKDPSGARWVIYTPRPNAYGASLTALELWMYEDDGVTFIRLIPGSTSGRTILAQTVDNAKFKYRWRNQSQEDIGNGRGWSNLSALSGLAYGTASGTQNDNDGVTPIDIDPYDSGDGCFVAGTMLRTPAGPRPIESFEEGAAILVWDFGLEREVESVVTRVEVYDLRFTQLLVTHGGRSARLTDEQPLFTGSRFQRSDRNALVSLGAVNQSGAIEIDQVLSHDQPEIHTVHHLHVAHPDHNYILANGIIAHNIKRHPI